MNGGMKDMSNVMSKFLALGLSLNDVILRSTWNPAQVIKRPELGNLIQEQFADIAVFSLRKGDFGFLDIRNTVLKGTQKLDSRINTACR
jgi:dihydroorotase